MSDLLNVTVTIEEYEQKIPGKLYRLRTSDNQWFSLWKTKQDGTTSAAFQAFSELGGLPATVRLGYVAQESKNKKEDGTPWINKTIRVLTKQNAPQKTTEEIAKDFGGRVVNEPTPSGYQPQENAPLPPEPQGVVGSGPNGEVRVEDINF